ncbi:MAG: hypothetical protein GWM98_19370 [Nitrospinaceae bacterium]|nr:hypothetical protein [Nitrospinaceae bacterium]NIR56248.1 hypothetical protein [Nitrospinaceae bacterium]NIS86704.1 hypothetical protein [Nitrospinaceae bacterium]NIT83537.1 hypothetical protein [Nitrospinaceae bacterium]NIU45742.1 hypothetical protein [Nitrospinaceae bacterium]
MLRLKYIILTGIGIIYGYWAWTGPVTGLKIRYGDSGLMWGTLVFGLMFPYTAYFIVNLFREQKKNDGKKRSGED